MTLLGHESGGSRRTISAAELENLIAAAEKVCEKTPALLLLKQKAVKVETITA